MGTWTVLSSVQFLAWVCLPDWNGHHMSIASNAGMVVKVGAHLAEMLPSPRSFPLKDCIVGIPNPVPKRPCQLQVWPLCGTGACLGDKVCCSCFHMLLFIRHCRVRQVCADGSRLSLATNRSGLKATQAAFTYSSLYPCN